MGMRSLVYAVLMFMVSFGITACTATHDIYQIIDGPGASTKLVTCFLVREVGPCLNIHTKAEGHIGQGPECTTGEVQDLHYHGTLFGQSDPNPGGCGWGRMAFVGQEVDELDVCCIMFPGFGELDALDLMEKNPPDYENAFLAVREAVELLNLTVEGLNWMTEVDPARLPEHVARQIKDELQLAISSDQLALAALDRLRNNQGQPEDETIAVSNLREALEAKQRAIEVLVEAGLLETAPEAAQ